MLIRLLYTLLLSLLAPLLLLPLYQPKPNKPAFGKRWREHWGITPRHEGAAPLWIHAVSVGESLAATPLIKALKAQHPERSIIVTTTTSTGAEQIAKLGDLVEHRYMPLDFPFAIKGFLRAIRPQAMLIIETELWPNTLHQVHKAGVPIYVINARLSERSCKRYAKVQALFNQLSANVTRFLCQSDNDAQRFARLGVKQEQLAVTGSIKFDVQINDAMLASGLALRAQLGKKRPVWIAASTHSGEDEQLLQAHRDVLTHMPDALLMLVPRHPQRFDEVFALCQKQGFTSLRRSMATAEVPPSCQLYLADTMGEMLSLMASADLCFMAGSLVGDQVGGHNVLEPAALALATLTGPSYFNFKDIVDNMVAQHALEIVDAEHLAERVVHYLQHEDERRDMGARALNILKQNQGAVAKTMAALTFK